MDARRMTGPLVCLTLSCVLGLSACGTTSIVTNDPQARIFLNGEHLGQGQATLTKRGIWGGGELLVKTPDGRRKTQAVSRSFGVVTFLLGFITYGVCWAVCWEYPDVVFVI